MCCYHSTSSTRSMSAFDTVKMTLDLSAVDSDSGFRTGRLDNWHWHCIAVPNWPMRWGPDRDRPTKTGTKLYSSWRTFVLVGRYRGVPDSGPRTPWSRLRVSRGTCRLAPRRPWGTPWGSREWSGAGLDIIIIIDNKTANWCLLSILLHHQFHSTKCRWI